MLSRFIERCVQIFLKKLLRGIQMGSPMESHRVNSIIPGRSPPLYRTLVLIAMQGHQNRGNHDILGT